MAERTEEPKDNFNLDEIRKLMNVILDLFDKYPETDIGVKVAAAAAVKDVLNTAIGSRAAAHMLLNMMNKPNG